MEYHWGIFAGIGVGVTIFQTLDQSIQTTNEELERYKMAEQIATQHLETFDELDFDVFTN